MEYQVYKLHFTAPIHVGNGKLDSTADTIMADTLFSALCVEALHQYGTQGIETLVDFVKQGSLCFSNLFPFVGDTLFLPKPLVRIETEQSGDSILKKQFKKLKYVSVEHLDTYLAGALNPKAETDLLSHMGAFSMRTMSSSLDEEKSKTNERLPFFVQLYSFHKNAGLYTIVGFENAQQKQMLNSLFHTLSFAGIGGKRSAGFGRFTVVDSPLDAGVAKKLNTQNGGMLLCSAMATPSELPSVLQDANYFLVRRAGFSHASETEPLFRKKAFYAFTAGSVFPQGFDGDVFDVATKQPHPVYRYAKPLFWEV